MIGIYTSKKKKKSSDKKIAQDIVEKVSGHVGHLSTKHFRTAVKIRNAADFAIAAKSEFRNWPVWGWGSLGTI